VIPRLQTSRLLLRPLELADAEQTQLLFPHWEIVRYLSHVVPWPYPADGAHTYYRDAALPAMARGEAWHWTLRLRTEPDRLIGCIALLKGEKINRGFWLGLPWHGQGLMTEACEAVTDYWFNTLKFQVLRAPKAAANVASCRIRLGASAYGNLGDYRGRMERPADSSGRPAGPVAERPRQTCGLI